MALPFSSMGRAVALLSPLPRRSHWPSDQFALAKPSPVKKSEMSEKWNSGKRCGIAFAIADASSAVAVMNCHDCTELHIFLFLWCAFSNATFLWTTAAAAGASSASTTTTALCTSEPCEFRNFFFFSSVNFAFAHVCSIKALHFFFFFFFLPWAPLSVCSHFSGFQFQFYAPQLVFGVLFLLFIAHLLRRLLLLCTIEAR